MTNSTRLGKDSYDSRGRKIVFNENENKDEVGNLREENRHLKSLLIFRDSENEKLRKELKAYKKKVKRILKHKKKLTADVKKLNTWIGKLEKNIIKIIKTKRWKIGNFLGKLKNRLLLREPENKAEQSIQKTLTNYYSWLKTERESRNGK